MKLKVILIIHILVLLQMKSFSVQNDSLTQRVFTLIYSQKFDEAEKKLTDYRFQLDDFYYRILNLDLFWWKYSMSRTREDAGTLKQVLDDFNHGEQNTPEDDINRLIQLSYRFRYDVKRFNVIGAILLRSDIREQLDKIRNENIPVSDNRLKLFNLYMALFEYSENSINPFMINSKSEASKKAIITIEKYTRDTNLIVQTLAHYFLGRIYMKVENKPEKAKEQFCILTKKFPENPYFAKLAAGL